MDISSIFEAMNFYVIYTSSPRIVILGLSFMKAQVDILSINLLSAEKVQL